MFGVGIFDMIPMYSRVCLWATTFLSHFSSIFQTHALRTLHSPSDTHISCIEARKTYEKIDGSSSLKRVKCLEGGCVVVENTHIRNFGKEHEPLVSNNGWLAVAGTHRKMS